MLLPASGGGGCKKNWLFARLSLEMVVEGFEPPVATMHVQLHLGGVLTTAPHDPKATFLENYMEGILQSLMARDRSSCPFTFLIPDSPSTVRVLFY